MNVSKYAGLIALACVMDVSLVERTEAQVAARVSTTDAGPLANDIDPVTRYRLPLATRADMPRSSRRNGKRTVFTTQALASPNSTGRSSTSSSIAGQS
jgi:hypothetical protein